MVTVTNVATDTNEIDAKIQGRFSALQCRVVVIALLLNMLDGFDITAMAFTAHGIQTQLSLSPNQVGLVFSITLAGMMLGALILAPLSDRIGRRKMVLLCVAVIGLSMVLTGLVNELWSLLTLRLITGLGVGSMLASLTAITTEYTPQNFRSLAVGCITAGYPLGATVGGFIAAPVLAEYGWQWVFIAGGVATLIMFVVVFMLVPESLHFLATKQPAAALSTTNKILQKMGAVPLSALPERSNQYDSKTLPVAALFQSKFRLSTLLLWSAFFFCFISLYFLMSWIPKLVILAGFDEQTSVYASVAFNGGAVVGIVVLGWIASRLHLSNVIATFLAAAVVCMLVFAWKSSELPLFFSLVLIGFTLQGGFVGLYAAAAKLYPTECRATGVGWAIGLGRFGAVVGPLTGGMLITSGASLSLSFVIFAIPLASAAMFALCLKVS